jgi:AcrR family transcriptional regulator
LGVGSRHSQDVSMQCYCIDVAGVKSEPARRTRRADKAEETRQRILGAATRLFAAQGYAATTIGAIADQADVAVETVYSRFGTKLALLREILDVAIVGNTVGRDILDLPEIAAVRAEKDQRAQLAALTRLSRGILERSAAGHRILRSSVAADPAVQRFADEDRKRRHRVQTAYIGMLLANGPLRDEMTEAQAAATYGALANPDTYASLTQDWGWSAEQYEQWLRGSMTLLLLPDHTP